MACVSISPTAGGALREELPMTDVLMSIADIATILGFGLALYQYLKIRKRKDGSLKRKNRKR
jgi:hypothetical protein